MTNEILLDIRQRLWGKEYQNEEHVRLSLVARVVQALGWGCLESHGGVY